MKYYDSVELEIIRFYKNKKFISYFISFIICGITLYGRKKGEME